MSMASPFSICWKERIPSGVSMPLREGTKCLSIALAGQSRQRAHLAVMLAATALVRADVASE